MYLKYPLVWAGPRPCEDNEKRGAAEPVAPGSTTSDIGGFVSGGDNTSFNAELTYVDTYSDYNKPILDAMGTGTIFSRDRSTYRHRAGTQRWPQLSIVYETTEGLPIRF
jgi:hypothetical protein